MYNEEYFKYPITIFNSSLYYSDLENSIYSNNILRIFHIVIVVVISLNWFNSIWIAFTKKKTIGKRKKTWK